MAMVGWNSVRATPTRLVFLIACLGSHVGLAQEGRSDTKPTSRSQLVTCLGAAADYSPVYPTGAFQSPVREVAGVFRFAEGETAKKMKATYIAVDVGRAAPADSVIAAVELDVKRMDRGFFYYSQPQNMLVGRYRIDVTADGRFWRSAEFRVAPAVRAHAIRAETMYPMMVGRVRSYAFMMEPGPVRKSAYPESKRILRAESARKSRSRALEMKRRGRTSRCAATLNSSSKSGCGGTLGMFAENQGNNLRTISDQPS